MLTLQLQDSVPGTRGTYVQNLDSLICCLIYRPKKNLPSEVIVRKDVLWDGGGLIWMAGSSPVPGLPRHLIGIHLS
jgi:hypothetical protein